MNNTKARPMRLVTTWVRIEESNLDLVIHAPSSDTKKVKQRLNIFNTRDDTILTYTINPFESNLWSKNLPKYC